MSIHWFSKMPRRTQHRSKFFTVSSVWIGISFPDIDDQRVSCSPFLVILHQVSLCQKSPRHFLGWVRSLCPSFLAAKLTFSCRYTWERSTSNFKLELHQFPVARPTLFLLSFTRPEIPICVARPDWHVQLLPQTHHSRLCLVLVSTKHQSQGTLWLERANFFMAARICRKTPDIKQTHQVIPLIYRKISFG